MIVGIGIDIVKVSRIEKLYSCYKNKFMLKVLSSHEEKKIKNMKTKHCIVQYLAKRFVAKEALVKAIGTGFVKEISLRDIVVENDKKGKPYYYITDKVDNLMKNLFKKKYSLHLSISDDNENAIANALIETFDDLPK